MDNNDNNKAGHIVFTEDNRSEVEALRQTIQFKQEMLEALNRKYNGLHELASSLIAHIEDDDNDIDDIKQVLEYERDLWARHGIDVLSKEYAVSATLTFNVSLTVTAGNEAEAAEKAEDFLGDYHHFSISSDGEIEVNDYNFDEADVNID